MEVVNCFYEEKKNAEYLERQIEECPVREKRFIKRGIEYLYLKNVYDVTEIEDSLIDSYALWLQEHGIKDRKLIGVYQKSLRDWRMFHKQKEFVKLKEELEECDTVEQTLKNKVYAFMVEKKIYSLEEIDWDVRVSYEQYLEKTINKRNRPWYLSGLDKLKLFDIKKRNNSIRETRIRLKYQEKRIYLGYHPDYNLAKEFYYCKDAEGIIWDFSIKTSQRLKYQIFTVLNYALENFSERKLRRGYLAPLHFFYVYCIDRGISDLTQLEQNQIDEYFSKAKEVPLVNNRYPQIVDKVQRILFLQAKDINWDANVWYLERFQFDITRYDPTRPVKRISFLDILDKHNREYLKIVRMYQVKTSYYEKPIPDDVAKLIQKSMEYTYERYGETEYVFVNESNPSLPFQYSMLKHRVYTLIHENDICKDNGERMGFATHLFRHCYGMKLVELHLDDAAIAHLLGHRGVNTVYRYRRASGKLLVKETEELRKTMDEILSEIIKEWDGYEQVFQNG